MNTLIQLFAFCYEPGVTRKKWNNNKLYKYLQYVLITKNKKMCKTEQILSSLKDT